MTDRTRFVKDLLWVFAMAAVVAAVFRLWYGLGATTNLSDAMPWGLWKILNMVGGVALSTSGFTVGFLVYVLGLKRFQPFLKPAILIAFLGYGCSCLALLFDIGLPLRFWHPLFMWNINSFLFEVFWCVMLYFTVTAIELAPVFLTRLRADKIVRLLHRIAAGVVIVGISLSSLHHSSLGSLFLVTPQRLHPLWYSPWLPLFFILSAMGAGLMFLIVVRTVCARWYDPEPVFGPVATDMVPLIHVDSACARVIRPAPEGSESPALRGLAVIAATILSVYAVLKIVDLFVHGGWSSLTAGTWESWLYGFEMLVAAILPVLLVAVPRTRHSPVALGVAAGLAALGLALNRLDVGIFGYFHEARVLYFPSLIEWVISLGVVSAAGLAFLFMVERFPIFAARPAPRRVRPGSRPYTLDTLRQIWNTVLTDGLHRVSLLAVLVIPLAFVLMYPPFSVSDTMPGSVRPATGLDAERAVLRIDGNRKGVAVEFAHADHQKRLGDSASCGRCHHVSYPGDRSTPCSRCHRDMIASVAIFDHTLHMSAVAKKEELTGWHPANFSCNACHDPLRPKNRTHAKSCLECHREDMALAQATDSTVDLFSACGFGRAMHQNCVECHRHERIEAGKTGLDDCGTCHHSLRPREATESLLTEGTAAHTDTKRASRM